MRAIRELRAALVVLGNAARQAVAWAGLAALALAACAPADLTPDAAVDPGIDARAQPSFDAPPAPDANPGAADAAAHADSGPAPDADTTPYRHTINIDGTNDFAEASDAFATTSASYAAYVSWDDTNLYVGYAGDDIGSSDPNKWVLLYFDTDPGATTGATVGEQYNTQQPGFPSGFGAEYYFRWKASNDFQDLQVYGGAAWSDTGTTPTTFQGGSYVESAIPLSALGSPSSLGVVGLMINETDLGEAAYAGMYMTSFTDGHYDIASETIPVSAYLEADFSSPRAPNDALNKKP